ncbi:hypothetical protein B0T24DRAFT_624980 [Lasiosphaeria ovina]|uniref:Secreted protein n=1 Tax=Lasiosphaeria ovina TaxID=92902 RepID=A0AAE0KDB6_9PEZI|nr:hypothetical protein B0T24DRAFT_624980 [Lasiosphaeria ovina]
MLGYFTVCSAVLFCAVTVVCTASPSSSPEKKRKKRKGKIAHDCSFTTEPSLFTFKYIAYETGTRVSRLNIPFKTEQEQQKIPLSPKKKTPP